MGAKRPRSLRADILAAGVMAAGLLPVAGSGAALADDAAGDRNEVVVTGERQGRNPYADPAAPYRVERSASGLLTEPLQDTPKTVTVLPATVLEDMGVATLRDLFRSQPGITLGTGEGGNAFGDRIFIRGYDARNDIYIDGVRDPGVGMREVFAVEQIEILKGPSGAFGGRGTTGGAVSLVSKQPREQDFADLELTVGTDETRRATIEVNRNLGGGLGVRVNAMTHESDVAGRDYVFNDRWGVAAAVAWAPTDRGRIGFDYYHLSTDYLPDWGHPYDAANNRPFQVRRDNFYGVLARDFGETFSDVATVSGDWRVAPTVKLHAIARYGQSKNAYTASAPEQPNALAGTVRANAKRRDAVTEYWTTQGNVTWAFKTGGWGHTLVAGYELSREETLNRARAFTECATLPCTGAAANPTLSLFAPDATIPFGRATAVTARPVITTETAALYVLNTVKFSPRWQALFGVRADDYLARTTGLAPDRKSASDYVSAHAGLVFKPQDSVSLFASYATSANPPCEQLDSTGLDYGGCDVRVVAFDPVRNQSFDTGVKAKLFGHFDLNASLFRILREDVAVPDGAAVGLQDQEVIGIEIGAAGNVTPRWSLFGGLTAFDTEVTASSIPAQVGAKFPNVSETSFNLTSRHEITDRLHLGGTLTYQSEKYGGTVAAGRTRVDGYWRGDLFAGLKLTDSMTFNVNVQNVTDELYYDALYRSATPFVYVAPGRSAMLTLDMEF